MLPYVSGARGASLAPLLLFAVVIDGCSRLAALPDLRIAPRHQATSVSPLHLRVVSSSVAPLVPTSGWQPSANTSVWVGALAGGGAGAGVGAGVCTVSLLCPPCYAACVATFGLGGAAVGAFGGQIAHRELATDPANRMLPAADALSAQFRAQMMATLSASRGIVATDGGSAALVFASGESESGRASALPPSNVGGSNVTMPDRVLEIALTEIHAEALRKGGFEVGMKARARLRNPSDSKTSDIEEFGYSGKRIPEGGGIEAEARRIEADIEDGMVQIARDICDKLVINE